jgi:hypothetical protein
VFDRSVWKTGAGGSAARSAKVNERSEDNGFEPPAERLAAQGNKDAEGSAPTRARAGNGSVMSERNGAGEGIRTLDPNLGKKTD